MAFLRLMTIADRGERGGQHHALDTGVARRAQHPERAFTRGHDQFVLVLGNVRWKRRGDVQHVLAALDRLGPSGVVLEIRSEEGQTAAGLGATLLQKRAHVVLTLEVSYRRAHLMARGQELQDGVAADEARAAGYQNCAHRRPPYTLCISAACRPADNT
jgi:hypothetical protein